MLKKKTSVNLELEKVDDDEDPIKPEDSNVQLLDDKKTPQPSQRLDDQRQSTVDLDMNESVHRLTEMQNNVDVYAVPEEDEEDPSMGENALNEMWKMSSPRSLSQKL